MNCKKGDMAIIIKSLAGNNGKCVTCLELIPEPPDAHPEQPGPHWKIDCYLPTKLGNKKNTIPDCILMPITPDNDKFIEEKLQNLEDGYKMKYSKILNKNESR